MFRMLSEFIYLIWCKNIYIWFGVSPVVMLDHEEVLDALLRLHRDRLPRHFRIHELGIPVSRGRPNQLMQSTYFCRVPQCMFPRRNWDSPAPFPPESELGFWPHGSHTRLVGGGGGEGTQFGRLDRHFGTVYSIPFTLLSI
jgi:hypothetical protein